MASGKTDFTSEALLVADVDRIKVLADRAYNYRFIRLSSLFVGIRMPHGTQQSMRVNLPFRN